MAKSTLICDQKRQQQRISISKMCWMQRHTNYHLELPKSARRFVTKFLHVDLYSVCVNLNRRKCNTLFVPAMTSGILKCGDKYVSHGGQMYLGYRQTNYVSHRTKNWPTMPRPPVISNTNFRTDLTKSKVFTTDKISI